MSRASAQDDTSKAAARRLAEEGAAFYEQKDYAQAHDRFERAYTLFPAPTLAVWEAKCLEQLDRLIEAEEIFLQVSRADLPPTATEPYREAMAEANAGVERLKVNIPTVLIKLVGADPNDANVRVLLDGKQLSPALIGVYIPMNPGRHTIAGSVRAGQNDLRAIDVVIGDRKELALSLGDPAPPPKAAPEPAAAVSEPVAPAPPPVDSAPSEPLDIDGWTVAGWAGVGLGAVGLGVGIGTGVSAIEMKQRIDPLCPEEEPGQPIPCAAHAREVNQFRMMRDISTASYIAGGVFLGAGVLTLIFKPSDDEAEAAVAKHGFAWFPWLSGASAGVAGLF